MVPHCPRLYTSRRPCPDEVDSAPLLFTSLKLPVSVYSYDGQGKSEKAPPQITVNTVSRIYLKSYWQLQSSNMYACLLLWECE